ncbi:predicted protein [Histoplasma capsulatum G186AR]|uniref:Uncharacterized protein n=1 Tax=Ajellomyces capsulatus (strain G186AR / H82 / ATCC MYA-2454 / RMSCC 2432) TaxID=447093 RepID=C0NIM3_AJECG|nr:uncharacterized protein HCBG_02280 [Histoplasma capsulatum G186AR]EEH08743.1 predicted protein [Histoplasma capsulatum G186AR]
MIEQLVIRGFRDGCELVSAGTERRSQGLHSTDEWDRFEGRFTKSMKAPCVVEEAIIVTASLWRGTSLRRSSSQPRSRYFRRFTHMSQLQPAMCDDVLTGATRPSVGAKVSGEKRKEIHKFLA